MLIFKFRNIVLKLLSLSLKEVQADLVRAKRYLQVDDEWMVNLGKESLLKFNMFNLTQVNYLSFL